MSSPVATSSDRRGLWRWTVASVATAALVVSGSGLVVFAQSGDGSSQGPVFVPADAVAYAEARLDLPAGQDEALAQMMTAFPGFADAGSFEMKTDELIGMVAAQAGLALPEGDLIGDVFTGEIGLALSELEAAMMGGEPSVLIGLAAADAEAAASAMQALVDNAAVEMTESTYNDTTIVTDMSSSPPMSVAMHGDWMLLGTGESVVQASIDVLDGNAPSLAEDPDFAAAWSRVPDDRLAAGSIDFSSMGSLVDMGAMLAEAEAGMALPMDDLQGLLPVDMTASLVAETDRLELEALVTPGEATPPMPFGDSELSLSFPADTQIYYETRELGSAVESGLNAVAEVLEAQSEAMAADGAMGAIDDIGLLIGDESPITALLGVPLPEYLDFVGDAGFGAALSSDGLWFGIAAEVTDAALADDRITSLTTILRLFTMEMEGEGVGIDSSEVGGVEVTTITLPIDAALAEQGLPIAVGDSIDVALTDDTLLIGLGDFVESAILIEDADSLGTSAGYVDALGDQVPNSGLTYVNVTSLQTALDPMLAMMAPEWGDIAPFAAGVDRIMAVGIGDEEVMGVRMSVITGQ